MPTKPNDSEFAPFYKEYVSLVPEPDIIAALQTQMSDLRVLAERIPSEHEEYRYAPDKWSIREVFGHLIDAERVFGYRAFCISRKEQAPLPSFDENRYIAESRYNRCSLGELISELQMVRETNLTFLRLLDDGTWLQMGTASNKPVSVRALAYIMAGHMRHHVSILHERYGVGMNA